MVKITEEQVLNFPFESYLNLSLLIQYWESNLGSGNIISGFPTDQIRKMIEKAPELKKPVSNLSILKKHKDLVGLLMSAVSPPALVDSELAAAHIPFNFESIYATPAYQKVFPLDRVREDLSINVPGNDLMAGKVMNACLIILNKFYNSDIDIDLPILITAPDLETGLERTYKVEINTQFVEVVCKGEPDPLDKTIIRHLLDNLYDTKLWLKHLKPEKFEFQGFTLFKLVDVTTQEMLSSIKYYLLRKDAITCEHNFLAIQRKLCSIFKLPEMKLGLAYFDSCDKVVSNHGSAEWKSLMLPEHTGELSCSSFDGSAYERAWKEKKPFIVEDLEEYPRPTNIEKTLLKNGIRNIIISPLISGDRVVGMLELATPYVGKLNPVNAGKLENVLPMFTSAVVRVLGERKNEVRALIQKECTAIHPTVEWKFLEMGQKILAARRNGVKAEMDDITFHNIYPLYGMSDVRSSSTHRSTAIQADLKTNLLAAKGVINEIVTQRAMPILNEVNYRLDKELARISSGLNSGDESAVLEFIKKEIEPVFNHFKDNESLKSVIQDYEKLLDPKLGVIYDKRKDFEYSLTAINNSISKYLDHVEQEAQDIFPHYFEKYKTDGVEYNMYVGSSLVKDQQFDKLYLRNFRLWQLITMCEIAHNVKELQPDLPQKLNIAQLILVHGEPLSIRFRKDEKHFDVDGAYNIRYEIVKKRIDKALIKGTDERLTQPGKIAIVYTQQREADEYQQYIDYLYSIDYLKAGVEILELDELQGAKGLKAMRVDINYKAGHKEFGDKIIEEVIQAIKA